MKMCLLRSHSLCQSALDGYKITRPFPEIKAYISSSADANKIEADEYQRDAVPKDQQFIHRDSHSNQRSGRGGGYNGSGYSNGRRRHDNGRGGRMDVTSLSS